MSFDVDADAYARFMGRFSEPLAAEFAESLAIPAGTTAIDVGCGPGALTAELVHRLGPYAVTAVDPSESFVEAARERLPGVDVRQAAAESLPFETNTFDLAAAQLVVLFMDDPVQGLAEMVRVVKPGGRVAANVWDHGGGQGPLSLFWRAARDLDPGIRDESGLAGVHDGQLEVLFHGAGLREVATFPLSVRVGFLDFDAWWQPFTLGVGPAGAHVASRDAAEREALRRRCAELLPDGPFEVTVVAWTAIGSAD